jgi:hypothetical protein
MSSERKEEKPSQAVAVCGESRTHGDNWGMGRHRSAVRPVPTHSRGGDGVLSIFLIPVPGYLRHRQRRSPAETTGAHADRRGLATT